MLEEDPRRIAALTAEAMLEFGSSLRSYARQRARPLSFLKALPRKDRSRTAVVTGGRPLRERTVLFYAQWLARHERAHVKQLTRVLQGSS